MRKTKPTSRIIGDIGEIIFENLSVENSHAYIKLEHIYNTFTPDNILTFKYGFQRLKIIIPNELSEEIRKSCIPTNSDEYSPSFVCDYLTVRLDKLYRISRNAKTKFATKRDTNSLFDADDFQWVEIKANSGKLSTNQKAFFDAPSLIKKIHFNIKLDLQDEFEMVQIEKASSDKVGVLKQKMLNGIEAL